MNKSNEFVGKRFGLLTVIKRIERPELKSKHIMWECLCDCGNTTDVASNDLKRSVENKSCGCYRDQMSRERWLKHGDSNSKLHSIWKGMRKRCNSKNNYNYHNYGGRGIKIHKDWEKYINFKEWAMNNGYEEGLSIERIDNKGDYEPLNCKWGTWFEQANNRRGNHDITYKGKTQTLSQWAREVGINKTTLRGRMNDLGWSIEDALTKPVQGSKKG